ncbi:MAG: hypothetical protein IPG44_06450 [Anaerolineales bacterium]|jgi:hypothetical protein|nr:hypothetical protein [Chloroflexota bacterium]MBK6645382.1 hypothetical protein [Anaerolineales bacterium]
MLKPEKFSDYLSMIALVFSSLSLLLSWRNFRRDRSHLKLSLVFETHGKLADGQYLLTITNVGRRPATLVKVDAVFWFQKRHNIFSQETVLAEGARKSLSVYLVFFPSISNPLAVRTFEAADSLGTKYRTNTLGLIYTVLTAKLKGNHAS